MEQRSNYAAVRDARIKFEVKECVSGMEQKSNCAAVRNALIMLSVEECA